MNNAIYNFTQPQNEPNLRYLKDSLERIALDREIQHLLEKPTNIPLLIGGEEIQTGNTAEVRMPTLHSHVLAFYQKAGAAEASRAIEAALKAHTIWSNLSWTVRAAILLKAADLLAGKYRAQINAAVMLGQGKNIFQAEIDTCEAIDFLRFNVSFASKIYEFQPSSAYNQLNKMEFRPLEGFVFTVSPFNFTAIASNLNMAPVMMGNTTVWKPATTSLLSNYLLMQIFTEAGLPAGVINFLPGDGNTIGSEVLSSPWLAGIHFTGSNNTFNNLWLSVAKNLGKYRSYPRLIGETGGKNFVFVHPTANAQEVATNAFRGAFEYQGQKCSAVSRMYVPRSLWSSVKEKLLAIGHSARIGDVTDADNFVNAVIDQKSFNNVMRYIDHLHSSPDAEIILGGRGNNTHGWFIEPTIAVTTNPHSLTMEEEIFGPVLTVYVYEDEAIEETIHLCNTTSPYGLTGAVFARDRVAASHICEKFQYAAGNFYINDKPTGAVVGLQPFGGSRASGTNDKAGGEFNLIRWVSPRTIKETFMPATEYRYDYQLQ